LAPIFLEEGVVELGNGRYVRQSRLSNLKHIVASVC
jgi:hypothetical protein